MNGVHCHASAMTHRDVRPLAVDREVDRHGVPSSPAQQPVRRSERPSEEEVEEAAHDHGADEERDHEQHHQHAATGERTQHRQREQRSRARARRRPPGVGEHERDPERVPPDRVAARPSLKLSSPTHGCSLETEKSNWTKLTQIEKHEREDRQHDDEQDRRRDEQPPDVPVQPGGGGIAPASSAASRLGPSRHRGAAT